MKKAEITKRPGVQYLVHKEILWGLKLCGLQKKVWITKAEITNKTRGSVGWACVAHLSFCFEET
jgi:uncharacterized membrane protein YhdT